MMKSWALLALATSAVFSTARAACVDIERYLDIPSPLTGDVEINLDGVDTIECGVTGEQAETSADTVETVTVDGGTLTLKSSNNVRFVNVGFTVRSGANIVFDMPKTLFGPNTEGGKDVSGSSFATRVEEGAGATFLGQVLAKEVTNVFALFRNDGTMEFKERVVFQDNGNVFPDNTGVVKFSGDATFKDNRFLALENRGSAYVIFEEDATFDDNASRFDGATGCSLQNFDTSTTIFRGEATFRNTNCREAGAVANEGDMTFEGKAYFNENENRRSDGGGVINRRGTIVFNEAVQFNNNTAGFIGGGIVVSGGEVVFSKAVTFDGNTAESGSAFAISDDGSLTFKKPDQVISRNAGLDEFSDEFSCTFGLVLDEATLIGFTGDDVCIPAGDVA